MTKEQNAAYRARGGLIYALTICACDYPITRAPTKTEHDEECPAHRALLAVVAPDEANMLRNARPFSMRREGDGWRGHCLSCDGEFVAASLPGLAREMVASHNHGAEAADHKLRAEMSAVMAQLRRTT